MEQKIRKIWVNPVERNSPQGRHKQMYVTKIGDVATPVTSMRKSRENGTTVEYSFPYNAGKNKLHTLLDRVIVNPLQGLNAEDVINAYNVHPDYQKQLDFILDQKKITEQTLLELKHGQAPDFYSDRVSYTMLNLPSDINRFEDEMTYLQQLKLILYPRPNMLTNETPRQELLIKMVEALVDADIIAKSSTEYNSSLHDFYVSEDNEQEVNYARSRERIEEAIHNLYTLKKKMSPFKAYQVACVLRETDGRVIIQGDVSSERVSKALSEYINDSNANQDINIENFNEVFNLTTTPDGAERLDIKYLVQQALNTNVLTHRDQRYIWHSKQGTPDVYDLGTSYEKLIAFFLKEYKQYNPKDKTLTNWYKDLYEEVKSKNIRFE